jgi:hypothetical protein
VQKKGIDAFWLKIIAIVAMTSDHIGMVFGGQQGLGDAMPLAVKTLLYLPGGLTFPIMAYLIVEGYRKTSNVQRYMKRLLLFAIVTQPIYMWALAVPAINVLGTLLLGLVTLYLYDRIDSKPLFYIALVGISFATTIFDWGLFGVPLLFAMYAVKDEKKRVILPIVIMVALNIGTLLFNGVVGLLMGIDGISGISLPSIAFFVGSLCAIVLLLRYNGQRGRNMKYFFYVYYPAHLLILGILRGVVTGNWLPW